MSRFKVVTWNVFAGTPVSKLQPLMEAEIDKGVTLFGMQEAGGKDVDRMCHDLGFKTWTYKPIGNRGQWRLVWDPTSWVNVLLWGELLSPTPWVVAPDMPNAGEKQYSYMAVGIFSNLEGQTLEFGSFHWPAHIQPKDRPPKRYQAAVESAIRMGELADDSKCKGVLYVGDTNWDTDTGPQTPDTIPYFQGVETGLREIQAPTGTHGQRQIDNMYIIRGSLGGGIRPVKDGGWVSPGGGDHKIHGREFAWRD